MHAARAEMAGWIEGPAFFQITSFSRSHLRYFGGRSVYRFCRSHRGETAGGLPRLCERIHRMFRAAVLREGVRRAGGGRKAVSKNRIDRAANSLVMVRLLICQTVYREHREPPARKLY